MDWKWWLAGGALLYMVLRAKKAPAFQVAKVPPPWDPATCTPVTPAVAPYINKLKEAANNVYGPGSTGEVCVEISNIPGQTLDARTDITLQVFIEDKSDVISLDLETLKSRSLSELTQSILDLQRI